MESSMTILLKFLHEDIFILKEGNSYWVAIKPICKILNVDFNRAYQNVMDHPFFSNKSELKKMIAIDNRERMMRCLPDRYIYAWILTLRSRNKELNKYQGKCYDLIYDYFHDLERYELYSDHTTLFDNH